MFLPTYEYECERCARVFEVRQRISDPALAACETCGGPVRRLLAAAPFILKGSGFYVNDYPSASRKKAQEAEKKGTQESSPVAGSSTPPASSSSSPSSTSSSPPSSTS